jgi:hypothetical protein
MMLNEPLLRHSRRWTPTRLCQKPKPGARYARHYRLGEDALAWLGEGTAELHEFVKQICLEHLAWLQEVAGEWRCEPN